MSSSPSVKTPVESAPLEGSRQMDLWISPSDRQASGPRVERKYGPCLFMPQEPVLSEFPRGGLTSSGCPSNRLGILRSRSTSSTCQPHDSSDVDVAVAIKVPLQRSPRYFQCPRYSWYVCRITTGSEAIPHLLGLDDTGRST